MVGNLGKFIDKNVPKLTILRYYILYIPYIITLILPIAMLLASMFSVGQMAKHNELIAIKSTGISLNRILLPLLVLGFVFSLFALGFGEQIVPQANQQKANIENEYLDPFKRRSQTRITNIFWRDEMDRRIFIGRYDLRSKIAHRVTIQKYEGNQIIERLDARTMNWEDSTWVLKNGFKRTFTDDLEKAVAFTSLTDLHLDFVPEQLIEHQSDPEDMSYNELKRFIHEVIRNGGDPKQWQVDLNFKLSTPFANFILILFGAPLASSKNRSGAIIGLIVSIVIYLLYFGFTRFIQTLGQVGTLPPVFSAWLTNGVFFISGLFLLVFIRK